VPKLVEIRWLRVSRHLRDIDASVNFVLKLLCFVTRRSNGTTDFLCLMPQQTRIAARRCLLGVSSKNFPQGLSLPQNFQRAFSLVIEKVE
jgi:hypothetical protein